MDRRSFFRRLISGIVAAVIHQFPFMPLRSKPVATRVLNADQRAIVEFLRNPSHPPEIAKLLQALQIRQVHNVLHGQELKFLDGTRYISLGISPGENCDLGQWRE